VSTPSRRAFFGSFSVDDVTVEERPFRAATIRPLMNLGFSPCGENVARFAGFMFRMTTRAMSFILIPTHGEDVQVNAWNWRPTLLLLRDANLIDESNC
jgi:hypothetical protein